MDPGNPVCDVTEMARPAGPEAVVKLPRGPNVESDTLAHQVLDVAQHLTTGKAPALTPGSMRGHAGVALMQTSKAALLVGYETGTGIIVKFIGTEADGVTPKLSPPIPIKSSKTGLGLSLGFDKVFTAVLLKTEEDVLAFAKGEVAVGSTTVDNQRIAAADNHHKETLKYLDPSKSSSGLQVVSVSNSRHLVCDFSPAGGTLGLDEDLLVHVYGARVTVEDLLAGNVRVPAAFVPIYDIIKRDFIGAAAQVLEP